MQVPRKSQILCRDGLSLAIDASDGIDIGWKWVIFRSSDPRRATKSTGAARQIRPRRKPRRKRGSTLAITVRRHSHPESNQTRIYITSFLPLLSQLRSIRHLRFPLHSMSVPTLETVVVTLRPSGVCVIEFNRPHRGNAFNTQLSNVHSCPADSNIRTGIRL
jgi:hypothetical protein